MTPLRGIALKLGSVFLFIVMAALIKATSQDVPPGEAVFFRSFFALPIILGWLVMRGDLSTGLKVNSPMGHFWRGFVGTAAMGAIMVTAVQDTSSDLGKGFTTVLLAYTSVHHIGYPFLRFLDDDVPFLRFFWTLPP